MATPPNRVSQGQSAWNAATSPRSTSAFLAMQATDVVVAAAIKANRAATENYSYSIDSSGDPTLTENTATGGSSSNDVWLQSVTGISSGASGIGDVVTATRVTGDATAHHGVAGVWFENSDGIGADQRTTGNGQSAESWTFTTQYDNSAIVLFAADWAASDDTGRTWETVNGYTPTAGNGGEVFRYRDASMYTVHVVVWGDAGTAGDKVIGSDLTGGDWQYVAVEVRGMGGPPVTVDRILMENGTDRVLAEDGSFAVGEDFVGGLGGALPVETETDAAQALGKVKVKALPVATETDAARQLGRVKPVPTSTEADAAQAIGRRHSRSVLASETEAAQPLGRVKRKALPTATETSSAQTPARSKRLSLPFAGETDTAQTISSAGFSPASETDAAQPLAARKTKPLPTATESDVAQSTSAAHRRALTPAPETDGALSPAARSKTKALPVEVEADAAQPLARRKIKALPTATESDAALQLVARRTRALPTELEADAAQPLARVKIKALPVATESDVAVTPVRAPRSKALPVASEVDTAWLVTRAGVFRTTVENDQAQNLGRVKRKALPVAVEADTTLAPARRKTKPVPVVVESSTAQPLARVKSRGLAVAVEADAARVLARSKRLAVPTAAEVDVTRDLGGAEVAPIYLDTDASVQGTGTGASMRQNRAGGRARVGTGGGFRQNRSGGNVR